MIYWPPGGGVPRFKRYLDEETGQPVLSLWDDIPPVNSQAQERLGYPTQKPEALLRRIIHASSNEGDVVLDPSVVAERQSPQPKNLTANGSGLTSPIWQSHL